MTIKETIIMYVTFNFGGAAYISVDIYDGKSLNECLKLRSIDIDGVVIGGVYIKVA